jgi:hypothetical protein
MPDHTCVCLGGMQTLAQAPAQCCAQKNPTNNRGVSLVPIANSEIAGSIKDASLERVVLAVEIVRETCLKERANVRNNPRRTALIRGSNCKAIAERLLRIIANVSLA